MARARDRRGRYIYVDKNPKDIFGPWWVPQINYVDCFIESSSQRGREVAS